IGDVEIAGLFVESTAEAGGVVGTGVGRDGKVIATAPSHVLRRAVDDSREPSSFEQTTFGWSGTLLIESRKGIRAEFFLDPEKVFFIEAVGAEGFAGFTT